MQTKILYLLLIISFYTISCSSPSYIFLYVVTTQSPQIDTSLKYQLESEDVALETSKIHFEMELENTGGDKIVFLPNQLTLTDDDGQKFSGNVAGDDSQKNAMELYSNTSAKLLLTFAVPISYNWSRIGSLKLDWAYQRGANTYTNTSKFLRHAVYYREVYTSYPGCCDWYYGMHVGWSFRYHPNHHHPRHK